MRTVVRKTSHQVASAAFFGCLRISPRDRIIKQRRSGVAASFINSTNLGANFLRNVPLSNLSSCTSLFSSFDGRKESAIVRISCLSEYRVSMDAVEERSSGASGSVVDKEDPVAVADCVGVADAANTVFISDPECNSFSGSALTVVLVMVALWFSCSFCTILCSLSICDRYSPTKKGLHSL